MLEFREKLEILLPIHKIKKVVHLRALKTSYKWECKNDFNH